MFILTTSHGHAFICLHGVRCYLGVTYYWLDILDLSLIAKWGDASIWEILITPE